MYLIGHDGGCRLVYFSRLGEIGTSQYGVANAGGPTGGLKS